LLKKKKTHRSCVAKEPEWKDLNSFQEDIAYQVGEEGLAELVLWEDLQQNLPKTLKVSPATAIPQDNR
jgi:hypothetical protein